MPDFIYLASQSPRRRQLLEQLGVRHSLLLPNEGDDLEEDAEAIEAVFPGELPLDYVERVTGLKLDAAVARRSRRDLAEAPILCSDTTVALGRKIYGKPVDAADAKRMLTELSGNEHRVLTAVSLQVGNKRLAGLSESRVRFGDMSEAQIDAYVASGEPMGKAGAYGIQGPVAQYVANLNGSYTGIMGLPLFETPQLLRAAGVLKI